MKRKFNAVTGLFLVAAGFSAGLQAQEPAAAPKAVPVEMYACDWREGKGMGDLAKLNKTFKAFADEQDPAYSAWTITPQFRAMDDGFDIGWLGSWTDGEAMGASLDRNRTGKGAEMLKSYMEVVDCSGGHILMSSVAIHAPEGPPDNGIVMFSSCKVNEKSTMAKAMEAHMKTAADMRERGAKASSWVFHPGLGSGETDFDYYWVVAMDSYSALGTAYESLLNKGGWEVRQKLFKGVVSCDSPRLYDASLVRRAASN